MMAGCAVLIVFSLLAIALARALAELERETRQLRKERDSWRLAAEHWQAEAEKALIPNPVRCSPPRPQSKPSRLSVVRDVPLDELPHALFH